MKLTRRRFLENVATGALATGALRVLPATAQTATPMKIGLVVLGDMGISGPSLVAVEKGYFKQNGIEAELIPFKGGPDLLKGVLVGSADVGLTGATDPLVFRDRGTTIRAVASLVEKNHFTLTVASQIKRVEDLKGGSISCTAVGANTWVFARMLAKKMGWEPEKDIKIVALGGFDAHMAALRRGEAQGVGKILMRLDEVTPKWISEIAYSTDEVIKSKKDALGRTLRALFQGHKFFRDHAEETIRIAAKGIGWSEEATRRAYGIVRPLLSTDGRFDLDALKFMQDTLLELGVLKQRLPLDQHYTPEFTPVKA
jgi:NitT/TauT family transport system substrate-binding protein